MTATPAAAAAVAFAACLCGVGAMTLCRCVSRRAWDSAQTGQCGWSIEAAAALAVSLAGVALAPWPTVSWWINVDSRPLLVDALLALTLLRALLVAAVTLYLIGAARAWALALEIRPARQARPVDTHRGGRDGQ